MAMPKHLVERRQFERFNIPCSSEVTLGAGTELTGCHAVNVSDGGILLEIPLDALPESNSAVKLTFSVPRSTPNTFMFEEFTTAARILRQQIMAENGKTGVALQFSTPLQLALKV
jgi:hypothetical protein